MMNSCRQLLEDNELDLEPIEATTSEVDEFLRGQANDFSTKAIKTAREVILEYIEEDWVEEDGTILLDELYEWTQFDTLQEVFNYIIETGDTDFEREIRDEECSLDLYGVYDTKLYNEVYRLITMYNEEVVS